VHLFVLWSEARRHESRIVEDLYRSFTVLDVVEVTWRAQTFAWSLSRMYGTALPPDSDKQRHCGQRPDAAVAVRDGAARYRVRPTSQGARCSTATSSTPACATASGRAAGTGCTPATACARPSKPGAAARHHGPRPDPAHHAVPPGAPVAPARPGRDRRLGVDAQLERTLRPYYLRSLAWSPGRDELTVAALDTWWVGQVAGGRELGPDRRELQVAGRTVRLELEPAVPVQRRAKELARRWR
jgi:hypothetical protein